jgi:hypothetical protein
MALRVVAKHRLAGAVPAVTALGDDPSSRVATAASRARARLAESR